MLRNLNRLNAVFILALVVFAVSFFGYLTNDPDPDYLDAGNNVSQTQNVGYDVPVHSLKMDNRGADTITLPANPGPSNNGGATNYAVFLDLIAGPNDVIVTQVSSGNTGGAGANFTVEVLVRTGTALGGPVGSGPGSSLAGWTSLDTVPAVQGAAANGVSLLFSIPPILVPAGDTVGVALRFFGVGPRYFGTGTPPYSTYSDTNISLITGDSRSTPFLPSGSFFASRALTGEIRYVVAAPPPPGNETLVLMHDTVATTVKRSADRDTLLANLPSLISDYDVMYFDTTTSLPDLSGYKTIIISETSFDAVLYRYLGSTAKGQIMTWLNTGSPGNKKALLMMGGDLAYNYSRSASNGDDTTFSHQTCGYIYKVDNGMGTAAYETIGTTIDIGNTRTMTNAPAGGGYYPDGASPTNGGVDLYRYRIHTAVDTLAGIGRNTANYVVASIFQDARYFTGGNFKPVLAAAIGYLVTNGGVITGVHNISNSQLPDRYSLAQNYPNPFNPTTKIKFALPKAGLVSLKVYDMLGREVQSLVNQQLNAGEFIADFDGANLSSDTYFYRLQVGDFVEIKKMVLLK